jgi:hypothetical protein
VSNHPDVLVLVDRAVIRDGTFGFINKAAKESYRVFLTATNADVTNLSNQRAEGTSTAKLTGKFMGSGDTLVNATFRPEVKGPDFDVDVRIENTDMRTMNDLLRAHGRFDVAAGVFSFYSQLTVKDARVTGYMKPLFSDLDVYDKEQDRDKPKLKKLYERVVEGASKILKNRQREEVATRVNIAGPLANPKASVWETLTNLIENAFIKAILPGFDREVRGRR